jgi:hypothetical protein
MNNASVDGVYGPVGLHFYSEIGKDFYQQYEQLTLEKVNTHLMMIKKPLKKEGMFLKIFLWENVPVASVQMESY